MANHLDDDHCFKAVIIISKILEQTMKIREFGVALELSSENFAGYNLKDSFDSFLKACFSKLLQGSCHQSLFANICYHICKLRGYLPVTYKQRIEAGMSPLQCIRYRDLARCFSILMSSGTTL